MTAAGVEASALRLADIVNDLERLAHCPDMKRLRPGFSESMRDYADALLREAHDLLATAQRFRGRPSSAAMSYRLHVRTAGN